MTRRAAHSGMLRALLGVETLEALNAQPKAGILGRADRLALGVRCPSPNPLDAGLGSELTAGGPAYPSLARSQRTASATTMSPVVASETTTSTRPARRS